MTLCRTVWIEACTYGRTYYCFYFRVRRDLRSNCGTLQTSRVRLSLVGSSLSLCSHSHLRLSPLPHGSWQMKIVRWSSLSRWGRVTVDALFGRALLSLSGKKRRTCSDGQQPLSWFDPMAKSRDSCFKLYLRRDFCTTNSGKLL